MDAKQNQIISLGAVFTAASQADRLARTGLVDEAILGSMIQSLLAIEPANTLIMYGGQDRLLSSGYRLLKSLLEANPDTPQEPVRYALSLLMLERKLIARKDLMQLISERLPLIRTKIEHFSLLNENVIQACAQLYEDTVSQSGKRIMLVGEPFILQRNDVPPKLRTLLLGGIRAAMQWQHTGGRRWDMIFRRKKLLQALQERLKRL